VQRTDAHRRQCRLVWERDLVSNLEPFLGEISISNLGKKSPLPLSTRLAKHQPYTDTIQFHQAFLTTETFLETQLLFSNSTPEHNNNNNIPEHNTRTSIRSNSQHCVISAFMA
jgi:hypothetical protein